MSIATDVTNAIVAQLKQQTFSQPFEPVMFVLPSFEPSELQTLRVSIVPRTLEIEPITRNSSKYTVGVDVGIQRRINETPEETVASLGSLVDEIAEYLRATPLKQFPAAQWNNASIDPLYVPEHLQQKRIFTSILNVKYVLFD
ncbi:MAG: hypothetical protein LBT05_01870 [Planctomycetaceae bacterium]|jgi:hypothetical protein|nr:hypothetical protein [Planctomycetaceae bacterium]